MYTENGRKSLQQVPVPRMSSVELSDIVEYIRFEKLITGHHNRAMGPWIDKCGQRQDNYAKKLNQSMEWNAGRLQHYVTYPIGKYLFIIKFSGLAVEEDRWYRHRGSHWMVAVGRIAQIHATIHKKLELAAKTV